MTELITFDDNSSLNLGGNSEDASAFHHYLYVLNEISIELSKTKDLNELYQRAIILANKKLGFERIGILRFNQKTKMMTGTWGVGKDGVIRNESDYSLLIDDDIIDSIGALARKGKVCLWLNREIEEFAEQGQKNQKVGVGWNAAFAFWDDEKMLGWVSCDNLISNKPFNPYQSHILRLFGTLIGELILRKQAQQQILTLNSQLEDKVLKRTQQLGLSQKELQQSHHQLEEKVLLRTKALASEKEKLQATINKLLCTEHSLEKAQKIEQFLTQDISSLNEMQEALQEANVRAETASIAKSHFIANISHELKTPMNAIMGNLNLLSGSMLTTEQQLFISKASTASDNLMSLINDLLSFSVTSQQKDKLVIHKHHIDNVISDILTPFSEKASQRNISLHCNINPSVPAYLYCDVEKLNVIINNLLGNAIKFTPQGDVQLALSWLENEADFTQLQLLITDTGIGIEKQYLDSLFHSFNAFDNAENRTFDGIGLGLALVEKQCRLMGAEIEVQSQIGKGTTFIINIPISPSTELLKPRFMETVCLVATDPLLINLVKRTGLNVEQVNTFTEINNSADYKMIIAQASLITPSQEKTCNLLIINNNSHRQPSINNALTLPFTASYLLDAISTQLGQQDLPAITEEVAPASLSQLSAEQQQKQLTEIQRLCQENNIDAITQTENLLSHFQASPQQPLAMSLHRLQTHLQHFDFDSALSLINELCST